MTRFTLAFLLLFCTKAQGQLLGKTTASKLKQWDIDEYSIVYSKKRGPVGPVYYEYDVFKKSNYLSYAAWLLNNDECQLLFREKKTRYILFNLCAKTKEVFTPSKAKLDGSEIDSILVRPRQAERTRWNDNDRSPDLDTIIEKNFDSTAFRKFSNTEVQSFVKRWKRARVSRYIETGGSYLSNQYLVFVYTKSGVRQFETFNAMVSEDLHWYFDFKDLHFFDKAWDK